MKVIGIIPARGGSKGIPQKNIRLLCGKPLLQYTAEAALAAKRLARVILSTEDEEIAEVGRKCGLEAPFLRPRELAEDDTPTLPVLQHAVRWLESNGDQYDAVCLLQPTNPMRTAADIDKCIALFESSGADSVAAMLPVPIEYNPHWVYFRGNDGFLRISTGDSTPIPRRQLLPEAFQREGSIYVTRRSVLMDQHSLYGNRLAGYIMAAEDSVNINTLQDWERAATLITKRHTK